MIVWNDKFSVNHQGIDNQHKKLIEIIEEIAFLIKKKDYGMTNLIDVLNELDNYVDVHFKYEESLMKLYSYPQSEEHINEHNLLRNKIQELNIFDVSNDEGFYNDLLMYLVDWLTKHIMHTDKKLGLYISESV